MKIALPGTMRNKWHSCFILEVENVDLYIDERKELLVFEKNRFDYPEKLRQFRIFGFIGSQSLRSKNI